MTLSKTIKNMTFSITTLDRTTLAILVYTNKTFSRTTLKITTPCIMKVTVSLIMKDAGITILRLASLDAVVMPNTECHK
jgi:hypothetical protein